MKLSIVTDEISQDPETAAEIAVDHWGIRNLEIREIWGRRVPDIDDEQRATLREVLNRYGAEVVAISPGIFKVPASQHGIIEEHLNARLLRSFELAEALGTRMIVIFSPIRGQIPEDELFRYSIPLLRKAAEAAEVHHMSLALENEPNCLANTGSNTASLVRIVQKERLLINWDPCNALFSGEDPFPTGYEQVRGLLAHTHVKDCATDRNSTTRNYVPIGQGETKARLFLQQLKEDGYQGYVSVETHFRPKVKGSKECVDGLRQILQQIGAAEE